MDMRSRGTRTRSLCIAAAACMAAAAMEGCTSAPAPREPGAVEHAVADAALPDEFTVAATALDTWNAVGQILVRTEGVQYESRAQMLGLYAVRYRGEPLLVLTRAQVMGSHAGPELTRVHATGPDGARSRSAAALELLDVLRRRLPDELALIAAGGRGRVRTEPPGDGR